MANYYCSARTNYFKVRDIAAFNEWAEQYPVRVVRDDHDMYGLLCEDPDGGGWPNWDHETDEEIDFMGELAEHLLDGEVAVVIEAGAEKLRYIHGSALAIDHKGNKLGISLNDIYDLVEEEWNVRPSVAEY